MDHKTDGLMPKKDEISPEECRELTKLMQKKYAVSMAKRYFETHFDSDFDGVYIKVILRNSSGSFYYPVEGRIAYDEFKLSKREAGLFLLDYIDLYFEEFFREGGDCYLPIDWADYEYDSVVFQLKGQILNLQVEQMADELLHASERPH